MRPDQTEMLTRARYIIERSRAWSEEAIGEAREMACHALDWRDVAEVHRDYHRRAGNVAGSNVWADYKSKAEAIAAHHLARLERMLELKAKEPVRASA